MEYISENEILPLIISQGSDFLAAAVTPWHAHNLDAVITKLKKEKYIERGIILISPSDAGNILITEDEFNSKEFIEIEFYLYTEKKRSAWENIIHKTGILRCVLFMGKLRKDGFYLISSRKPNYSIMPYISTPQYMSGLVAVIYDEGLAMYMRDEKRWLVESFGDEKNVSYIIHYVQRVILESMYEKIMRNKQRYWDWGFLKLKTPQNYVVNSAISLYLIETLKKYALKRNICPLDFGRKVLLLTQPYAEENAIDTDVERMIIGNVIDTITKFFPIVHKAHPREVLNNKYGELKLERLDELNGVSVETVLSVCKSRPVAVVGYTSTALITIKMLWGIPTISLIDLLGNIEMSQAAKNDFNDFRNTFGNSVLIPKNLEELSHELSIL